MMEFKVNHEKELNRFILVSGEGERVGRMSYMVGDDNIMTLDHTKVSLDLRGTGAGKHLIVAAV
ncbi:MAG: N-acetyltransferase, partial [Youngiibacter sp.]|nr:N-acetyltransferase [Youngiibacter sp.]